MITYRVTIEEILYVSLNGRPATLVRSTRKFKQTEEVKQFVMRKLKRPRCTVSYTGKEGKKRGGELVGSTRTSNKRTSILGKKLKSIFKDNS